MRGNREAIVPARHSMLRPPVLSSVGIFTTSEASDSDSVSRACPVP